MQQNNNNNEKFMLFVQNWLRSLVSNGSFCFSVVVKSLGNALVISNVEPTGVLFNYNKTNINTRRFTSAGPCVFLTRVAVDDDNDVACQNVIQKSMHNLSVVV